MQYEGSEVRVTHALVDIATVAAIRLPFGRHAGLTIERVYILDPDYLDWMRWAGSKPDAHPGLRRIAPAVRAFLRGVT